MSNTEPPCPYASRGGLKLEAALKQFELEPSNAICADLGCSTGGFVSCWLAFGAKQVYAVDTAYGELAWTLRQDDRVEVLERQNALHVAIPEAVEKEGGLDFVSLDLGWTRQDKALPAALRWLKPGGAILSLVKPHYEQPKPISTKRGKKPKIPPLSDEQAKVVTDDTLARVLPGLGLVCDGCIPCPIRGGKGGNLEFMALIRRNG